jgi:hypothetical protein
VKADLLQQEFAPRCVPHAGGSPLLLGANDALDLVDRASEEGVPVVRVHALLVATGADSTADSAAPPADFSAAVAGGHGCWVDAERFIRARGRRGVAFDVALGGDPLELV